MAARRDHARLLGEPPDRPAAVETGAMRGEPNAVVALADALEALSAVEGFAAALDDGRAWITRRQSWIDDLDEHAV